MLKYLARRTGLALVQILAIMTVIFMLLRIMPGDPAVLALGTDHAVDPAAVEAMRSRLGLDQPLATQYIHWMGDAFQLDLGASIVNNKPVVNNIAERFPRTLVLVLTAVVLASVIGILLGLVSAVFRNSPLDRMITALTACGISLPVYVLGTLLIIVFSLQFNLLPAGGYTPLHDNPAKFLQKLVLPALTIAMSVAASITRMTRSAILDELNRDYVRTLRAKGVPERVILLGHTLRNAMIPIVTTIGLQLGNLIGGTVLIETLFTWPGINTLLVSSISARDYPMVQGCILCIAVFYILVNLAVDLVYSLLDPRVRTASRRPRRQRRAVSPTPATSKASAD